jgi:hypothetical protein
MCCGPMCAKTACSLSPVRKPILKPRRRGNRQAPPPKSCLELSAVSTDTPAPVTIGAQSSQTVTASRLDKQQTIELAKETLQAICISQEAPSNAKATAARTLLELVGALGRHADPTALNTVPASEMSLEQLEARIAALITH